MIDIHFDRPVLNPNLKPEENIAVMDRWAAEMVNLLNYMVTQINRESTAEDG